MISGKINILLADDDKDDCLIFKEALEELDLNSQLTTVHDGEQLMQLLANLSTGQADDRHGNSGELFDVLFLDLNMQRKNGFECLEEIKRSEQLKSLPVIILSTLYDPRIADQLYKSGAQHYISKPTDFSQLKKIVHLAITLTKQSQAERVTLSGVEGRTTQPSKKDFYIKPILL